MVRHVHPFFSSFPDLDDPQFHVLVNGFVVLGNFSAGEAGDLVAREYFIKKYFDKT
jgi:hypothetical protein